MYTLGINATFHDSSACLVKDGVVIAAAEDERFTHIKHGKRPIPFSTYELPFHAIDYCLREAGIHLKDVDHFAYGFDPYIELSDHKDDATLTLPMEPSAHPEESEWDEVWEPLRLSSVINAPRHLVAGYPLHLQKSFHGTKLEEILPKWRFVEHHTAHAASAFQPSPYTKAAVLTMDGRGEKATTTYNLGEGNNLTRISQVTMPNSLGMLYEQVTDYLGFLHSSDEYKVMALASYGKPEFLRDFQNLLTIGDKGTYTIKPHNLVEMFGPKRLRGADMTDKHFNIASSLQVFLEDTVLELTNWLADETKAENLCMAGGIALNCVMNSRIRDKGKFKNVWVQPASGDAGVALGAAMWVDAKERKTDTRSYVMEQVYLGPSFTDEEIEAFLKWTKLSYKKLTNIPEETAEILAQDKVIGWYQGRMEFGPRALGDRSILASPIHPDMQQKLNNIKDREDFRPVAPVVLEEEAKNYFKDAIRSPFMLFIFDVLSDAADKIPAVRHVDGTARVQTINREQNQLYYDTIKAFFEKTGVPVLVNTSFNTRSEPVVCTPRDAIESYLTSPLDALIIGSFLLEKK